MNLEYDEIQRATKERVDIVAKYDLGREEGAQIDPWEDPAFEVYHVTDRFGFIHDKALPKNVDAAEGKHKLVEKERTTKWLKMVKAWDRYYPGEKLTRRVYKGIPDCLRGEVWSKLLNIPKVKAEQEGIYQIMRNRARTKSTSIRQIDLDVNRTYRNHIMFRERYGVKQQALFHVLAAYSVYNTEIGYCQGMSEVAALLLMYLNEEDAFWGLSQLFVSPRHMMHGFFMHGFPKLLRFQDHHDTVLRKFLPKVRRHLEKNDIYPSLYTIKWFLQCFLDRTPFNLTLRLWDIHMLDGEQTLVSVAYCIIKMHRRHILKMQMDELLTFFQSSLEKDFVYDSDTVLEQLQICMEELKKARMSLPPKSKANEQPTLPFGLEIQPSVEQLIGRRSDETVDEHFRKNVQRPGGKAAYMRRKNAGSMTGGANLLSTPEMTQSRGGDMRSLHSRVSQYSLDDKSSFYDTATNSRMSLTDYSAKNSAPSSRTSFGDGSEMGSMPALGQGFLSTADGNEGAMEVVAPATPTNTSPLSSHYNSPSPLQLPEYSSEPVRTPTTSEPQQQASTTTTEHTSRVIYHRSPRPGSLSKKTARRAPPTTTYHSSPNTPTKQDYNRNTNTMKGSRSYEDEQPPQHAPQGHKPPRGSAWYERDHDMPKPSSSYELSVHYSAPQVHLVSPQPADVTGRRKPALFEDRSTSSSDYNDVNGRYDMDASMNSSSQGHSRHFIPISKSEGLMSSIRDPEMVLLNGDDGRRPTKMRVTRTENDIQHASQHDHRKQPNLTFQNGFQPEQVRRAQSKTVYSRVVEKTSHL